MSENNSQFNWKQAVLVIVTLIASIALIIFAVRILFWGIESGIYSISLITEKLDAVVIVALITGAVSIATVFISTVIGKRIEYKKARQKYLAEKREELYENFVSIMYKTTVNTRNGEPYDSDAMISDLSRFSEQLTLWGSKKVVKKWNKFRKYNIDISNKKIESNPKQTLSLMEDVLNAMREDLSTKKTKENDLLALIINDIDNF